MARIPLTSGFTFIPEGSHVFKIMDATYEETFGKVEIKMETKDGLKYTETYRLLDKSGKPSDKAMNAFSFFAKTVLQDMDREDVDVAELVGRFIKAQVVHTKTPARDNPERMLTFVNLGEKEYANGFEGAEPAPAAMNLSSLLGNA